MPSGLLVCPGAAIDASCILAYGLILETNKGAIVHASLPITPQATGTAAQQSPAAGLYRCRIGG